MHILHVSKDPYLRMRTGYDFMSNGKDQGSSVREWIVRGLRSLSVCLDCQVNTAPRLLCQDVIDDDVIK